MTSFRRVSAAGRALIKAHEGLRLEAYPDPASGGDPWTIGYGHTKGVKPGDVITEAQADAFLAEDLAWVEAAINRLVSSPISQAQFDALASLTFNVGAGAFERSTLLRELNRHDHAAAAAQFSRWIRAAGKVMPGLVKRRAEEAAMFRAGMYVPAVQENAPTAPPAPSAPLVQPGPEPIDYHAPSGEAPEWVPPPPKGQNMDPFTATALSAVLKAAPALIDMFKGDSKSAERNSEAAKVVVGVAKEALQVRNEQELVQTLESDPQAKVVVREAIERNWFEIQQEVEKSRAAARKFVVDYSREKDVRTVVGRFTFIEFLTLVFLGSCWAAIGLLATFEKISEGTLDNIIMVAVVASIAGIREFWYGSSFGSRQKDEKQA